MSQKNIFRLHYLTSLLLSGFINYKLLFQISDIGALAQVSYSFAMLYLVYSVLGLLLANVTSYRPRWILF